MTTRSPAPTPRPRSTPANVAASSRSCRYVSVRPVPAEEATLARQRGRRRRRGGPLGGDRLVVVGARDGVDDLRLVELVGAIDHRYVADEHTVAHHLRFKPGGTVGVPDRLPAVEDHDPHAELVDPGPLQVRRYPLVAQCVD